MALQPCSLTTLPLGAPSVLAATACLTPASERPHFLEFKAFLVCKAPGQQAKGGRPLGSEALGWSCECSARRFPLGPQSRAPGQAITGGHVSRNTEPAPYMRRDGRCHTRPSPDDAGRKCVAAADPGAGAGQLLVLASLRRAVTLRPPPSRLLQETAAPGTLGLSRADALRRQARARPTLAYKVLVWLEDWCLSSKLLPGQWAQKHQSPAVGARFWAE